MNICSIKGPVANIRVYNGSMESATELSGVLDDVSGHLNAQHARLVDAAVTMLANPSWWSGEGVEEPHRFLCWRTAVAPGRAKQIVTIAERVDELPTCMARFRAGELSVDQMAAIATRAPWWTDGQIAELAPMLTVSQLRRSLAQYPFPDVPNPDESAGGDDAVDDEGEDATDEEAERPDDADDATSDEDDATTDDASSAGSGDETGDSASDGRPGDQDRAWWGWGDDGRLRLYLEVGPDSGMVIEQALCESRDRLFDQLGESVASADAVRDIAERSLDKVVSPSRRDRFRVNLHLDVDGDFTDAVGRRLPDSIRRHVGCDGSLSPVFHRDAVPVSVGRTQRVIPPRLRRQVIRRDHGACRVPSCGADAFVEIHHVEHWEDHGVTESWNLLCLCPAHHRMHHRGELGITGNADEPDGVTFTDRRGRVIAGSGARPTPPGAPPPPPSGRYEHPLGERLDMHWLTFVPPGNHAA